MKHYYEINEIMSYLRNFYKFTFILILLIVFNEHFTLPESIPLSEESASFIHDQFPGGSFSGSVFWRSTRSIANHKQIIRRDVQIAVADKLSSFSKLL